MNRTVTLGDYIREAEVFRYSKDYFDMVKEASEIELMGIYLTANDFLVENTLFIESATASYISRMFTESEEVEADGKPISSSKADSMKTSMIKRIWNGILKALRWIAKPFRAMRVALDSVIKKYKEKETEEKIVAEISELSDVVKEMQEKDIDKNHIEEIMDEFNKEISDLEEKWDAAANGDPVLKETFKNINQLDKKLKAKVDKDLKNIAAELKLDVKHHVLFRDIVYTSLRQTMSIPGLLNAYRGLESNLTKLFNTIGENLEYGNKCDVNITLLAEKIIKELNEDCKYSSRVLLYSDAQQQVIDLREKEVLLDALIDEIKDKIDKDTLPVDLHTHFTRLLTILNEMNATLHKNIPTAVAELNERYKDRVELNVAFVTLFKHIKTKFKMIMAKRNT